MNKIARRELFKVISISSAQDNNLVFWYLTREIAQLNFDIRSKSHSVNETWMPMKNCLRAH